jgi:hypothetical protein
MAALARLWISLRVKALVLQLDDYCPGRASSFGFAR